MRAYLSLTLDLDQFLLLLPIVKTHGAVQTDMLIVLLEHFLWCRANMTIRTSVAFLGD